MTGISDPLADVAVPPGKDALDRVGWKFISLYTLAYMSTCLVFIAPALVTLALKVNSIEGIQQAPDSLALVTGIGALVAMFGNPLFGRISDPSRWRYCLIRSRRSSAASSPVCWGCAFLSPR
jgi:MFS family permease